MQNKHLVIIGGGACGVAAFIELFIQLRASQSDKGLDITIIEPDQIGKGLAFGTQQPGHLLNTQADLMGIHPSEPSHYASWLKSRSDEVQQETIGIEDPEDAYSTRRLYSDYLRDQFQHYYEIARTVGAEPAIIQQHATDIRKREDLWEVKLGDGELIQAEYVLLALGTPKPTNYEELEDIERYVDFPWPSQPILEKIGKKDTVGILGCSLSAIDTVMTLADNQHEGPIRLYSPDGMLPRVQPKEDRAYQRRFFTREAVHQIKRTKLRSPRVTELFRLFQREAEHYTGASIDWQNTSRTGQPAALLLDEDINYAKAGGDAFINILYSLRYESSTIWHWLSADEKQKFKRWIGNYWSINRHGMPLANALRLQQLFRSEQLSVHPGLIAVDYNRELNQFEIEHTAGKDSLDYLINATGPGSHINQMKSTLVQNLRKSNLIEAYESGGIKIEPGTMQVLSNNEIQENLYVVGHLCNGILLDVNAVWFNMKCIAKASRHILTKLTGEHYA